MSERADLFYESREWLDLRYRVLKSHNGCCALCGDRGNGLNPLQVDHIKPRSKFPELALEQSNLQVLCRNCNFGKSNTDTTDWRWAPSQQLIIIETADAPSRAKLQQLGWLKVNGGSTQIKKEAHKAYRELWRDVEAAWFEKGRPRG